MADPNMRFPFSERAERLACRIEHKLVRMWPEHAGYSDLRSAQTGPEATDAVLEMLGARRVQLGALAQVLDIHLELTIKSGSGASISPDAIRPPLVRAIRAAVALKKGIEFAVQQLGAEFHLTDEAVAPALQWLERASVVQVFPGVVPAQAIEDLIADAQVRKDFCDAVTGAAQKNNRVSVDDKLVRHTGNNSYPVGASVLDYLGVPADTKGPFAKAIGELLARPEYQGEYWELPLEPVADAMSIALIAAASDAGPNSVYPTAVHAVAAEFEKSLAIQLALPPTGYDCSLLSF